MKRKKKMLAGILVLVMALSLTGCGQDPESTMAAESTTAAAESTTAETAESTTAASGETNAAGMTVPTSTTKDSIVIATNFDPGTMNPYEGSFGPQLLFSTQSLETLFLYDSNGNLIPWLVKSYEYDEDKMGITLHLQEGVTFHNGDPMTAEDVVFSFSRVAASPGAAAMMSVIDFDGVEAVDEYTVYVPTVRVSGTMGDTLSNLFVLNKNTYDDEAAAGGGITGTGPWKVTNWQSGVSASYQAYEDYWGGAPILKTLDIRIITESSVRMIELENGTVDIYKGAAATDIARVNNGETQEVKVWKANSSQAIHYMGFNLAQEPFDNELVRQAVCYAIDSETLTLAVFEGIGEVGSSLLPGNMWYSPDLPEELQYPYNPDKAKELLAEAGYADGLTVTLNVDSNVYRTAMAELLPSMLSKAGITLEVNYMETAAYNSYMMANNDYGLFLGNFGNLYEPSGALSRLLSANNAAEGGSSGYWHYAGTEVSDTIDDLMAQAGAEEDTVKRAKIYEELCTVWAENALSRPIADFYDVNLVSESLEGMFYSPNINLQYAYFK